MTMVRVAGRASAVVLALAAAGCGPGGIAEEPIASQEEPVYIYDGPRLFTENNWQVPVCFIVPGPSPDKDAIRSAIENAWEVNSGLDFTGWGDCPATISSETVGIWAFLVSEGSPGGGFGVPGIGGRIIGNAQILLRLTPNRIGLKYSAAHEMGHAIGLVHEHQRPDARYRRSGVGCMAPIFAGNADSLPISGQVMGSAFDPLSLMSYCRDFDASGTADNAEGRDFPAPSALDVAGIQLLYGVPPSRSMDAGFWAEAADANSTLGSPVVSWNSAGATANSMTKIQDGFFRVDFPRIGANIGGNVQVTTLGGNERCKVTSWGSTDTTLNVYVQCLTPSGAAANPKFTVSYLRRSDTFGLGMEGAYVWSYQTTGSYVATGQYAWNSSGRPITITRNPSQAGDYSVAIEGQSFSGGTAQVTAYGSGSEYCKVGGWSRTSAGQNVGVRCFTSTGGPADASFTLRFMRGSPSGTPSYAYAWTDQPNATSTYTVSSTYQLGVRKRGCGDLVNGAPTVSRVTTSAGPLGYRVTFPGAFFTDDPRSLFGKSNVTVSSYGSQDANYCSLVRWTGDASSAQATVNCFNSSGAQANGQFTINYSSLLTDNCEPALPTGDVFSNFTSEEPVNPPAKCDRNTAVGGAWCTGAFCDNVALVCRPLQTGRTLDYAGANWSHVFSEENSDISVTECTTLASGSFCYTRPGNGDLCVGGTVMTGFRCTGASCDNVQIECTPGTGQLSNCAWSPWQSEEQGFRSFSSPRLAAGAKCRGSRCDDLSFLVCDYF